MDQPTVLGFQFEPEFQDDEEHSEPEEYSDISLDDANLRAITAEGDRKAGVDGWCTCGHCVVLDTERECITEHDSFSNVMLDRGVLWTALVSLYDRENASLPYDRDNVPSQSYRYASYRQFSWFIHTRLGRGVRRVIPACVVAKIRTAFPSESGNYTGFRERGTNVHKD
ncbi:P2X purinoceptor 7-like [Hydractinia symbiolongicarpus]|uniref:P2X purinoceptor 7-like n=1 Tax=Hydractinia symbiolongicarpus TaxID=13093 RepID=UPI002550618D|nr:P2X purinoceptor 7-like [Hydractinia symbiolongicarpus]